MAATFQAARSTVRRALDQLEKAGLVSRRLGSGTFVGATAASNVGAADLADQVSPLQLIEARLAVEPYTTRLAVLHATRRNLDDMEVVLVECQGMRHQQGRILEDGTASSISCSPMPRATRRLINVYRQINHVRLHAQWDAMKEKILTPEVIIDYNRQHRAIYNALNERDAPKALRGSITEHLEKARDDLVQGEQSVATPRAWAARVRRPRGRRSYMTVGQRRIERNASRRWERQRDADGRAQLGARAERGIPHQHGENMPAVVFAKDL